MIWQQTIIILVIFIIPLFQQSWKGGILVSPCPSVDRIMFALYLQQYSSDPFHICTSYQATSEGVSGVKFVSKLKIFKFWQILEYCNFDFVFFWLGIQYNSIVWVIIRLRRVSSEHRHSSCSSFISTNLPVCWGLHKMVRIVVWISDMEIAETQW